MSYQREYKARIKVAYSGSVSYPKSDSGGTKNYSGETYEDVIVKIDVDASSFNNSIRDCNNNVKLLTGSVVAAESAQIVSINKNNSKIVESIDLNSQKVAGTIVNGFYKLIRSEISQQIAELTQGIDSQLMHLKELSKSVVDKKRQMEGDFLRISSRYIKTFDDLNNELSNRIFELDKPTFVFKKELDDHSIRTTMNELVNTVAVFGKEGSELQTKISASIAKKRALDTLNKVKVFLWQQKKLNNTVQRSMLNESTESPQYSPVLFIETKADKSQISKGLHTPSFVSTLQENQIQNELIEQFNKSTNSWSSISKDYNDNLKLHFNSELNKAYTAADQHSVRVKEMIQKMANLASIQTINV